MNKKIALLLVLPFLLTRSTQSNTFPSFDPVLRKIEGLEEKRKQATQEYITSKIAEGKTYDNLIQEIKENINNQGVVALLVIGLIYRTNQEIEQLQEEKKKELAARLFKDLTTLALIMEKQQANSESMSKEQYEQEVKPFLCNLLFANKTPKQIDQQVKQEIEQTPSNLMQTVIFGQAKHCDCIKESWEEWVAKHNIEIKRD